MSVSLACYRSPVCLAASISRLEISTLRPPVPSSTAILPRHQSLIQQRHASTPRRFRKLLNLPPAPVLPEEHAARIPTGGSGRSHRQSTIPLMGDTVVYNPPSSAPNVYHTPVIFLPKDDPRRRLAEQQQAIAANASSKSGSPALTNTAGTAPLPPPLHQPRPKSYHLGPADIEEMRRLRQQDERTWTRTALAKRFDCSSTFVGIVVQASDARRQELKNRTTLQKKLLWGAKRRKARDDRTKRKELWKYD